MFVFPEQGEDYPHLHDDSSPEKNVLLQINIYLMILNKLNPSRIYKSQKYLVIYFIQKLLQTEEVTEQIGPDPHIQFPLIPNDI